MKYSSAATIDLTGKRNASAAAKKLIGITILSVISAAACAASADVVTVKYYGYVDGFDYTGVFGSVGSLTGDAFVATYEFDASPGQSVLSRAPSGFQTPIPSVFKSASLEINGATHNFRGAYMSSISAYNTPQGSPNSYSFYDATVQSNNVTQLPYKFLGLFNEYQVDKSIMVTETNAGDAYLPGTIDQNFSGPVGANGGGEFFSVSEYVYVSTDVPDNRLHPQTANGYLRVNYLTVSVNGAAVAGPQDPRPTAAVPEPASWVLMLSGFGAIGGMLRRNRRAGWPLQRLSPG